jgi:hypothetical protein
MYPSPNAAHILGWRVDLRFDPDGWLYVGTVRGCRRSSYSRRRGARCWRCFERSWN